jgi:hypothetical protein
MRVQDACLALMSLVRDIQEFDPSFEKYGDPYPDYKSGLSDWVYSLLLTKFKADRAPAWNSSERVRPTLTSKFTDMLDAHLCRKNFQEGMARVERVLKDAVAKYGEDRIVSVNRQPQIQLRGDAFVSGLQKAGFVFEDPEFLDMMLRKVQQTDRDRKAGLIPAAEPWTPAISTPRLPPPQ